MYLPALAWNVAPADDAFQIDLPVSIGLDELSEIQYCYSFLSPLGLTPCVQIWNVVFISSVRRRPATIFL